MPDYHYQAVRKNGELIEGLIEAENEQAVLEQLRQEQLLPIQIKPAKSIWQHWWQTHRHTLSDEQILNMTRELATLLDAGLTLDRALQLLIDLSDDHLKHSLQNIREKVQAGSSLSDALAAQKQFSPLYVNMIKAGESGGALQDVLLRLTEYLERSQALRSEIKQALIYPSILFLVSGLSVIGLLVFVVPQFEQMFVDMGAALPWMTQIVVDAGNGLRRYWWLILAGLFLSLALFEHYRHHPRWQRYWHRQSIKIPVLGDLLLKIEMVRFSRTLAILLHNGLPLLSALNLVQAIISNSVIAQSVQNAAEQIKRGKRLAEPLIKDGLLPVMALQMIKVGEESGDLAPMLNKIADIFDQEVRHALKRALTLLEPIMIVTLGLIVAFIIVAILMAVMGANELAF